MNDYSARANGALAPGQQVKLNNEKGDPFSPVMVNCELYLVKKGSDSSDVYQYYLPTPTKPGQFVYHGPGGNAALKAVVQ